MIKSSLICVIKPHLEGLYPVEQIFANKQTFEVDILFFRKNHFKIQYDTL